MAENIKILENKAENFEYKKENKLFFKKFFSFIEKKDIMLIWRKYDFQGDDYLLT